MFRFTCFQVIHFDYGIFEGNISTTVNGLKSLEFRAKDWGPAPRWVAFVDFFLASRAKHAVVSGAHRRVGTTYAQLIAALAAARNLGTSKPCNIDILKDLLLVWSPNYWLKFLQHDLILHTFLSFSGDNSAGSSFSFLSSFQNNLLREGLRFQVGWGHVWNRFAGPLSCHNQGNQCAFTPLLPPAWWDGLWQSPLQRDINRLELYGVQLTGFGTTDEIHLQSFCNSRKYAVKTIPIPL